MGIEYSTGFCDHCNDNVKIQRKTPNHIFHFIMSILTCGIWLIVWALIASEKESWRCSRCGKKLGGGSNGWGLAGSLLSNKPKPKDGLMKKCPFCAEMIRAEARLCRFCQRELPHDTLQEKSGESGTRDEIDVKTLVISLGLVSLCLFAIFHFLKQ